MSIPPYAHGVGFSPKLVISPQSLTFGPQTVGVAGPPLAVGLSGEGGPVSFYSLRITGEDAADFSLSTGLCGLKDPIVGWRVTIQFVPRGAGKRTASLVIVDNAVGSPQTVPLGGLGVAEVAGIGEITTYAGTAVAGYRGDGGAASKAWLTEPVSTVADSAGNLYISDLLNHLIRFVNAKTGVISTYAGQFVTAGGYPVGGYGGDGGKAIDARLNSPFGLALDKHGNLYIADIGNSVIRKVTASTGVITTVAGLYGNECNYLNGQSGDGGPGIQASLCLPQGIAFDGAENLYIADTVDNVIRRVDAGSGTISTYAGSIGGFEGLGGFGGDGGPATQAILLGPSGIQLDKQGNLYIADTENYAVREVNASTGIINTIAGRGGVTGFSGDGGPATGALLSLVYGIGLDHAGNVYIADHDNSVIRKVDADTGTINTVAGNGFYGDSGDGGPAISAEFTYPIAVDFDAEGNFYVADIDNNAVRKVTVHGKVPSIATPLLNPAPGPYFGATTVAITDDTAGTTIFYTTDGATPTAASTRYTAPIPIHVSETLKAIALHGDASSIEVSGRYTISPAPVLGLTHGSGSFGNLPVGASAQLVVQLTNLGAVPISVSSVSIEGANPLDFAAANPCTAYFGTNQSCDLSVSFTPSVDGARSATLMINSNAGQQSVPLSGSGYGIRTVTTFAGLTRGVYGNGGAAKSAELGYPQGIAVDIAGNRYIADTQNAQVRKVNKTTGEITIVAGAGQAGFSGDGQLAINAQLNYPEEVAVDSYNNLYIADSGNDVIRKVSAATGIITTFAGAVYGYGYSGDGGPATQAQFSSPSALALDESGNLYIADSNNNVIRKVTAATGIITTVAGSGDQYGYSGDGGPATSAMLSTPEGVAVDAKGNIYIADTNNYVVRKVAAATGTINTYAGTGSYGYTGDGGPATAGALSLPQGLALSSTGDLYIADFENNVVRKVTASNSIITTVAGSGTKGFSGDQGPAGAAALNTPQDVAVDAGGILSIADTGNNRIRQVIDLGTITTIAGDGRFSPIANAVAAANAPLATSLPNPVAVDAAGNIYFADVLNNVVRKVAVSTRKITTVAGTGQVGYTGDGGLATAATLNSPQGLAIDEESSLYIADTNNLVIRKVNAITGIISTFAGNAQAMNPGDGGPAIDASLSLPHGLAFDAQGDLYIATPSAFTVRVVNRQGIIHTAAGNFTPYFGTGPNGDGGSAQAAVLAYPVSVAVDVIGNLYIGGEFDHTVREVNAATGIITTVVGAGGSGDSGDGGPALQASINVPFGLNVDSVGNLYIADLSTIRVVNASGMIGTAIGQGGYGYSGDGGPVALAQSSPVGVAVDSASNIYFADAAGNRIREVSTVSATQTPAATPEFTPMGGSYPATQTVSIADATAHAQIFYSLDGSVPNPGSSTLYTGPLTIIGPITMSAIAIAPGYSTSITATASFNFPAPDKASSTRAGPVALESLAAQAESSAKFRQHKIERLLRLFLLQGRSARNP